METQNITLALPKELLHKVKLLAVQRRTSVSGLLSATLAQMVEEEDNYARAHQRYLARLEQIPNLGSDGQIVVTRDELHERT